MKIREMRIYSIWCNWRNWSTGIMHTCWAKLKNWKSCEISRFWCGNNDLSKEQQLNIRHQSLYLALTPSKQYYFHDVHRAMSSRWNAMRPRSTRSYLDFKHFLFFLINLQLNNCVKCHLTGHSKWIRFCVDFHSKHIRNASLPRARIECTEDWSPICHDGMWWRTKWCICFDSNTFYCFQLSEVAFTPSCFYAFLIFIWWAK